MHCLDNMGRPCKLVLTYVLHVPNASRNLMSASALAAQGYQTVLPSINATFPPVVLVVLLRRVHISSRDIFLLRPSMLSTIFLPVTILDQLLPGLEATR